MEITSVRRPLGLENVLLINNQISVPEDESNRYYRAIQEWLAADPENEIQEPTGQEIADYEAVQLMESKKNFQRLKRSMGEDVIDETKVILDDLEIDAAQAVANMTALAPVQSLLQNGSLTTARGIFATLDLTGVSLTEDDRTYLLNVIDSKISELAAILEA